jgi:hypothetical protein
VVSRLAFWVAIRLEGWESGQKQLYVLEPESDFYRVFLADSRGIAHQVRSLARYVKAKGSTPCPIVSSASTLQTSRKRV